MRVMTVFGTRPEAIKMAPLVLELKKHKEIESIVVVTAQHRQMLDQVLDHFKIVPDFDLNIMTKNQTLVSITALVLEKMNEVISSVKPDIVLVHGDTTTTFASSLAAFYNQVKVGHVEAGLRTYDKYSPYPEEMNRQLTGIMTDFHFAPTKTSANYLIEEGKNESTVYVTGNTAIDALKSTVSEEYNNPLLSSIVRRENRLILLTAHRRENLGDPMRNIFKAVKRLHEKYEDIEFVYPVHMNPVVKELAQSELSGLNRVHLINPLEVFDFHNFASKSYLILTDSGGVQEEAPSLGVPVLVLRDTTERPEGVEAGTLKLVGTNEEHIFNAADLLLSDSLEHQKMSLASNPYGDGRTAEKIVSILIKSLTNTINRDKINI
ncbi:UDP-N-acetylglucosamine 2-epimerase (non-hydrolyzing) [Exiguobacterium sp. s91]|uniref:non-hydrolyzing UDP-N-acetylglucosamine 2-epimerase n=1 Tax=Exiguobacterium sp. s91 TaxID=2751199 RepID=UPI001BE68782|nr:UDP-N-acetylglucosamine 2-epimerase (non-hydrolyzing) [Exiguobacterium sp. s91]